MPQERYDGVRIRSGVHGIEAVYSEIKRVCEISLVEAARATRSTLAQLAVVTAHRGGDAEMVKTLFQGLGVLFAASGFPTVVTSAAIGVTMLKTALPGRWLGWLSLAVVAVHVPSVPSLAQSGVLALDGVLVYLAPPLFIVWAIATSVALIRLPADRLSQHLT